MLFHYTAITQQGVKTSGNIDAAQQGAAIESLQSRGLIVVSVEEIAASGNDIFTLSFLNRVKLKDIVIMSRQVSSLFDAQVSAVKVFNLMAESAENPVLKMALEQVSKDIQSGIMISDAMKKHPKIFSGFYVNMVRAGEESGKLTDTFSFLADYLDRQYELTAKTKNALIYPAFVIFTFIAVMVLMMVLVIPKLTAIITDAGADIPIYTKIVIGISNVLVNYGFLLLVFLGIVVFFVGTQLRKPAGQLWFDGLKLKIPFVGNLFTKMYLSRIADNLSTMLGSGIPVVRTLEITQSVVGNKIFETILAETIEGVRSGSAISDMFAKHPKNIPSVFVWMIRTGEETGTISNMLKKIATYYKREVEQAVDTLIGMIEPAMIVSLGLSVAFLLMSVLVPIYNVANTVG
jgi:type IV pilus assembly protein PilC